jgi:hypothetical protein
MIKNSAIKRFRDDGKAPRRSAVGVARSGVAAGMIVGKQYARTIALQSITQNGFQGKGNARRIPVVT